MLYFFVFITFCWLLFLFSIFLYWSSLIFHTLYCSFVRWNQYKQYHQEFLTSCVDKDQLIPLKEWDRALLQQWVKEEDIPEDCPKDLTPEIFASWLSQFPPQKLFIPQENGEKIETLGRDAGDVTAPTYGFLHGIWDSSIGFIPLAYHLWRLHQGKVRLIFQEMPGHGGHNTSEKANQVDFRYPALATFIGKRLAGEALDTNGNQIPPASKVTLFGNSMGGSVCLLTLAHYPKQVSQAIPINPALIPQKKIPSIFVLARFANPTIIRLLPALLTVDIAILQISSRFFYKRKRTGGHLKFQHWHRYSYIIHPNFPEIAVKVAHDLLGMLANKPLIEKLVQDLKNIPKGKILLVNGKDDIWLDLKNMTQILQKEWKIAFDYTLISFAGHCAQCDQAKILAEKVFHWQKTPTC